MSIEKKEPSFFANQIRLLRKQMKLTQKDVADALQIERSTYAFYETGKTTPSLETLCKLSKVYGVPVDDLLQDKKIVTHLQLSAPDPIPYKTRLDNPPPGISRDEMALILSFRQLSPLQKEKFLDFFSTMVKTRMPEEQ